MFRWFNGEMMVAWTKSGVSENGPKRSVWGCVLEVAVTRWTGFGV